MPNAFSVRRRSLRSRLLLVTLLASLAACGRGPAPSQSPASDGIGPLAKAPGGAVVYAKPLVVTKGGRYSGNWESLDPNVPAVLIRTTEPVVIQNANIRGRGRLIVGTSGNRVTVRNSRAYGLNPNVAGRSQGEFVYLDSPANLVVGNNAVEGTRGIVVHRFSGNVATGDTVRIVGNRFRNVMGLPSDGQGGYTAARTDAHTILFDKVQRVPNVEIAWNEVVNEPGRSGVEENFNLYISSGTPGSPIRIHDNYVQGAYNLSPTTDSAYSGGGILVGDGYTTTALDVGYTEVYDNQVVSTTNEGVAVAGGVFNRVYRNRVVSSGLLVMPDGSVATILAQNVGMYAYNASSGVWGNNAVTNNEVAWMRYDGGALVENPFWFWSCAESDVCAPNVRLPTPTLEMERQEWTRWQDKVVRAGVRIGP
ncbi:hypothetical protein [Deinococcus pimensis]|uniref:hypothetical protein n=1 Tax=Deinococcus pimensis TaxID=309888 RepID=UPI0004B9EE25|nr:hypothetical protein [Deinococcus pimensis]